MLEIISTLFKPHSPQLLFTRNVLSAQNGTPCQFLLRLATWPCPILQPVRGLTLLLCPCISIPVSHAVFYTKKIKFPPIFCFYVRHQWPDHTRIKCEVTCGITWM